MKRVKRIEQAENVQRTKRKRNTTRASWYELQLSSVERKTRGHFSTPHALVEQMLDACGYFPTNAMSSFGSFTIPDATTFRVLDPACGDGNFLSAVACRLVAFGKQAQYSEEHIQTLLQQNVWGFDPDPVACFLAEMQVRTAVEPYGLTPEHLHIHQADGLAFPWYEQQESVDLFLANPPYLAAKNNDLSFYLSAQGRGQVDSYLLFLDLALRVVRPGGWIGLVVPDAVLARANATRERQRLLSEMTIHHLWHLSSLFPAYVGAVVLIAQKNPAAHTHAISWRREKWYVREKRRAAMTHDSAYVPQSLLRAQMHGEFRYLLGGEYQTLITQLQMCMDTSNAHEQSVIKPLDAFMTIHRGEELGKANQLVSAASATANDLPLLRGGVDIQPYMTPHACYWLTQDAIVKPLNRYRVPKLLVVKSTRWLQATLDMHGHVVLQTLYMLSLRQQDTDMLYFLLALLNSDMLRNYVYVLHTAYKLVQPQIEQHVLARLPIPILDSPLRTEIVQRAKDILAACDADMGVVELKDYITQLHAEQERAIIALYQDALHYFVNKGVDAQCPQIQQTARPVMSDQSGS